MLMALYYLLPTIVTIWAIYYFKLPTVKILVLSILPPFLYFIFLAFEFYTRGNVSLLQLLLYPFAYTGYIYIFIYPTLIAAALITIFLQKKFTLNILFTMFISSVVGVLSAYTIDIYNIFTFKHPNLSIYPAILAPLSIFIIELFTNYRKNRKKENL